MNWYRMILDSANRIAHVILTDDVGCFGATSQDLARSIDDFAPARIELLVNSAGGDSVTGMNLHALFSRFDTRALISGRCYSAALFATLGAQKIAIAPTSRILIHSPAACVMGNAETLLDVAVHVEWLRNLAASLISQRTEQSREIVHRWLAADTYFTAQEALSAGLVDEIIETTGAQETKYPPTETSHTRSAVMPESESLFRSWLAAFGDVETANKREFAHLLSDWFKFRVRELPSFEAPTFTNAAEEKTS